jgi:hypothetical protein
VSPAGHPPAVCHLATSSDNARAQQTPDSTVYTNPVVHPNDGDLGGSRPTGTQIAYPTDAKEREKARRQADKEAGVERVVQKRKKVIEDHYDDCGDDLSSLHDAEVVGLSCRQCHDLNEVLSDEEDDNCLKAEFGHRVQCYPVDYDKIAKAQPGGAPTRGSDERAPAPSVSTCPGCRHYRARSDWEHTRGIGQCKYP